jgi:rubrerythrin
MGFLGKLLGKDSSLELKDVMINLELLADAETQISDFYRLCAGAMPQEKDLWNHLANQELQHSDMAMEMLGRIAGEPTLYDPGISFSTVTIRLFDVEMRRLVEQMNQGRISPDKLFSIALEIENSAVELSYGTLVKTDDAIYKMLAHRVDNESAEHKSAITSKMMPV